MFPSFEDDGMTAFSRDCCGKNNTIPRLLDITSCLLSLRMETIKLILLPPLLACHDDLSSGHVCRVRKWYAVQGQDESFTQP